MKRHNTWSAAKWYLTGLIVLSLSCQERKAEDLPTDQTESTKLLFQSERDGNSEIYIMNSDGTGQQRLTDNEASDEAAAWSPFGDKIVFVSDRDGNRELYLMNVDGSDQKRLTNNPGYDTAPRWTSDGKKIMFGSDRNGRRGAFIMNADGTDVKLIPPEDFNGGSPSPSPDGLKAAVEHESGPEWTEETEYLRRAQIFIVHTNGEAPIRLTNIDAYNGYPAWSPDGDKILFDSNTTPGSPPANIMCIDIKENQLQNLTNSQGYNEFAAWSPDGRKIAFVSDRDGNNEIYIMNADGSQQTRLTNNNFDDTIPSWSPLNSEDQ